MREPLISKSKYLSGLQCPKLLWTHYNDKEALPEVDEATQARFDQGHQVGELAKRLYPGGVGVSWEDGLAGSLRQTQSLLAERRPLFEASFSFGGAYARADILNPVGRDQWDIIEVKSAASVKDVNLPDVAVQRYCYEGAGLRIRRCLLMHVNGAYVRKGEIDPAKFFTVKDVTDDAAEAFAEVPARVGEMRKTIALKSCPNADIGPHCSDPYECPLMARCWAKVWEREDNIFTLPRIGKKAWQLYGQGVVGNGEIPGSFHLTGMQSTQVAAERSGKPHISPGAIREFLSDLTCPLHFLDFETFMTAIPLIDRSRPYEQIPFQYSLHVVKTPGARPKHHSWLWDGEGDPRKLILEELRSHIGDSGSIIVYNAAFERQRLEEAAEAYPAASGWVKDIRARIVDLWTPFRSFDVYYPSQHGSSSLKAVLPALTGKGYGDLEITDGGTASVEFLRVMFTDVGADERERVRRDLEEYCGLDAGGMIDILRVLSGLAG